jgi:adenine phosphoribosyltransferase
MTLAPDVAKMVRARLRDIPDFPRPGIVFKDISPVLADPASFRAVVDGLALQTLASGADILAGIEARGFLLAAAAAYATGRGVVPLRKPGKLPGETLDQSYSLEYGQSSLHVQVDALQAGTKVLIVDDVLATGGTAVAARTLVTRTGAHAAGLAVLLELEFLGGRRRVGDMPVTALLTE